MLGSAVIIIGFLVTAIIYGFIIYLLLPFALAVLFAIITVKDRLFGGLLSTVISGILLVPISISLGYSESRPGNFVLFAILVCLFMGGAGILASLAMSSRIKKMSERNAQECE